MVYGGFPRVRMGALTLFMKIDKSRRWSNHRGWSLYSCWDSCQRAHWTFSHHFLLYWWNSSCSFCILLYRACVLLPICWKCISLLIRLHWRRASFFGGVDKLPSILARQTIFGILVDPGAAMLVVISTALLCTGIKESSLAQAIITTINISALVFIILAGAYLGCKTGWPGYEVSSGYFSFGVNGLLAGSATVFFSYIGFDIVASTAEEVKYPQRDMPLGIGIALSICGILYMLVSAVIVGLVPYYALDPDTPISSAFAGYGMEWAVYIITAGAVTALCASLIGAIIPQPRIPMAMARDGLLPSFFSDISKHTQVPVKGTIATRIFIAILAFFMDVSQLAGMVSVGTLLSFTVVALSILILRYVPPDELPFLPSDQQLNVTGQNLDALGTDVAERPLLQKDIAQAFCALYCVELVVWL